MLRHPLAAAARGAAAVREGDAHRRLQIHPPVLLLKSREARARASPQAASRSRRARTRPVLAFSGKRKKLRGPGPF